MSEKWECSSRQCKYCELDPNNQFASNCKSCAQAYCKHCLYLDEQKCEPCCGECATVKPTEETPVEQVVDANTGSSACVAPEGEFVTGLTTEKELNEPTPAAETTATNEPIRVLESDTTANTEQNAKGVTSIAHNSVSKLMLEKAIEDQKNKILKEVQKIVPVELLRKENPTDEDKTAIQNHIREYLKKEFLKRYDFDNIDLEAEYNLIQQKKSNLSRNKRDAVVAYFIMFVWGPVVEAKIKELQAKENRTPEEEALLKELIESDDPETMKKNSEEITKNANTVSTDSSEKEVTVGETKETVNE